MGVRTRGLDIAINAKRQVADAATRAEAKGVVERWNEQLAGSRDMLWSPTIRAALIAGTPWLDVFCPGCGTSRAIDLRKVDRHPLASVATLVLGLRCSWCPESAPMPRIPRFARTPACGEGRDVEYVILDAASRFGCFAAPRERLPDKGHATAGHPTRPAPSTAGRRHWRRLRRLQPGPRRAQRSSLSATAHNSFAGLNEAPRT
jgi:hypothetical protein